MSFMGLLMNDVAPESIGLTYSHEHIVCRPVYWVERGREDLLLDDPVKNEGEVRLAKLVGVGTIVDVMAIDYGWDPEAVHQISLHMGMQIVGTVGFDEGSSWDAKMPGEERIYREWIGKSPVEELTRSVINEVEVGMQDTGVKGEQVKLGTGCNSISLLEIRTMRAGCRAHLETGIPAHSHTGAGTMTLEQMKCTREEGVDLPHVSFGHMGRNPDIYYYSKIADTETFLCFDGIARVKYNLESVKTGCTLELAKRGYQK